MVLKAIVFDLTQTLQRFDFLKMEKEFEKFLKKYDETKNVAIKDFMHVYRKNYNLYQVGLFKNDSEFVKGLMADLKLEISEGAFEGIKKDHLECRRHFITLAPGVKETLEKLKKQGFRLAILSNAVSPWLAFDWPMLNFNPKDYFEEEFYSHEFHFLKPNPRFFLMLLNKMKIKPEEALMVGDHPYEDIKGAKGIWMHACYFNFQNLEEGAGADYTINNFDELLEIVKNFKDK